MSQHMIPSPPPITDAMTTGAVGASSFDLVGARVMTAYDIPDSDRGESLLLLDSGRVILLSCDLGYNDDAAVSRNPTKWVLTIDDATDTPAGHAIKTLEPGQWL